MSATINDTALLYDLPLEEDQDAEQQAERQQDRYELLTERLLDATELDRLPQMEPLVADLLDLNTINWLQGKPGHAKSFVALDLACHVALGRPWWDREVHGGPVLYVAAEGAHGMRHRLRAWEVENKTRLPSGSLTFLPVAVQLLGDVDPHALGKIIADLAPVLVVIDTQARVTVGGEENSAKDMGRFVDHLEVLRASSGAAVLVVHHEGRSGDHLRGSTAMEGAAHTIMRAKKDGRLVELSCAKQKDHEDFEPIYGNLVSVAESAAWSHFQVGLPEADTRSEQAVVSTMWDQFETTGASTSQLIEATGISKASVHRAIKSLVRKGFLVNEGTARRTFWVLSETAPTLDLPGGLTGSH